MSVELLLGLVVAALAVFGVSVIVWMYREDQKDKQKKESDYQRFQSDVTDEDAAAFLKQVNGVLRVHNQRTLSLSVDGIKRFMFTKSAAYRSNGYIYRVNVLDETGKDIRVDLFSLYDGLDIYQYSDYYSGDVYLKRKPVTV